MSPRLHALRSLQMQRALLEHEAARATAGQLAEKLAALDAALNVHKPAAGSGDSRGISDSGGSGGAGSGVTMLHEAFTFKLPQGDGSDSPAALELQRLLPALDAILGDSLYPGTCSCCCCLKVYP